jgi:hypothetical protein
MDKKNVRNRTRIVKFLKAYPDSMVAEQQNLNRLSNLLIPYENYQRNIRRQRIRKTRKTKRRTILARLHNATHKSKMKRMRIDSKHMQPMKTLYEMFDTIQEEFSIGNDEEVYNRIIEIFGDYCRLHPMPTKTKPMCDAIPKETIYFFLIESHKAFKKNGTPLDYFGSLYESLNHLPDKECHGTTKKKIQGINLTCYGVTDCINRLTLLESKKESEKEKRPLRVIEPSCGTGRFILDALAKHSYGYGLTVYGIEKDPWLYRTCLINLKIYFPFSDWLILNADFLLNDLNYLFQQENIVNQWNVLHWKKLRLHPAIREEEQKDLRF